MLQDFFKILKSISKSPKSPKLAQITKILKKILKTLVFRQFAWLFLLPPINGAGTSPPPQFQLVRAWFFAPFWPALCTNFENKIVNFSKLFAKLFQKLLNWNINSLNLVTQAVGCLPRKLKFFTVLKPTKNPFILVRWKCWPKKKIWQSQWFENIHNFAIEEPFLVILGFWYRLQNFEKSLSTRVTPYWDKFWKFWRFKFLWRIAKLW